MQNLLDYFNFAFGSILIVFPASAAREAYARIKREQMYSINPHTDTHTHTDTQCQRTFDDAFMHEFMHSCMHEIDAFNPGLPHWMNESLIWVDKGHVTMQQQN